MFTTLALLGTLALAPSQGEPKFDNARFTFGYLGQSRSDKFLPGDSVYLSGVVKGLTTQKDGTVKYAMAMEINKKGNNKPEMKKDAVELSQLNWLGGGDVPFIAEWPIPHDSAAPGSYTMKLTCTDVIGKKTATLSKEFTVEKSKLGFIRTGFIGQPVVVAGDPRLLRYSLVGFELDKSKKTDLTVTIRVLDEKGKPTVSQVPSSDIKTDGADLMGIMSFRPSQIETNRPGRYQVEVTAKCNVSKAEVKEVLDLTVIEVK